MRSNIKIPHCVYQHKFQRKSHRQFSFIITFSDVTAGTAEFHYHDDTAEEIRQQIN